ncbi:hypothetical protein EOI86_18750 [Hwanghaeella grinnelliae]|uniref:Lipoprotein n=1 Tax=Hwanghaeella grinnelliae TaxID=2500179 RepID=A0A3S2VLA6_9PROT|nr:hypothetical protein [Hwanghaeella grinnelliae]RVU34878.1 hypothetical protein EOI86_18750 [Hwanghaeella grinnelliae]
MRRRGPVALLPVILSLFALTGCFESEDRFYTEADLWADMPEALAQTIVTAPYFEEAGITLSATGGGSFTARAEGADCPFGVVRMAGAEPEDTAPTAAIPIAVFNLEPGCHFDMAESPWLVYAARLYPPGHDKHAAGIAFGVPGDSGKIVAFAQAREVTLTPYRTNAEDRYKAVADTARFKAFLPAYMQSDLVAYIE